MEWIITNNMGFFNNIFFIFYKVIYVYLLKLGGYVCLSVSYRGVPLEPSCLLLRMF